MNVVTSQKMVMKVSSIPLMRSYCTSRRKDHYESLNINKSATQSDVKGAYYKLSMMYHPDRNRGDEAAEKFRDITEAYEVLGNVKSRRLYDKGICNVGARTRPDPDIKMYRSEMFRARTAGTGRTIHYDFDEWTRAHYGATFAKDMKRKRAHASNQTHNRRRDLESKVLRTLCTVGFVLWLYLLSSNQDNEDQVRVLNLGDMGGAINVSREPESKRET